MFITCFNEFRIFFWRNKNNKQTILCDWLKKVKFVVRFLVKIWDEQLSSLKHYTEEDFWKFDCIIALYLVQLIEHPILRIPNILFINHNLFHSGAAKKFLRFGTFNTKYLANFFKFNLWPSSLWVEKIIQWLRRPWDIVKRIGVLINPIFEKFVLM